MRAMSLLLAACFFVACDSDGGFDPAGPPQADDRTSGDAASACAAIEPPADVPMRSHERLPPLGCDCGAGTGDGSGTIVLPLHCDHCDLLQFFGSSGSLGEGEGCWASKILRQPVGVAAVGRDYLGPYAVAGQRVHAWDSSGALVGSRFVRTGDGIEPPEQRFEVAPHPMGGVVIAGAISASDDPAAPLQDAVVTFTGGGAVPALRWGSSPLASAGPVRGVGVDLSGRTLVITEGALSCGDGALSGQWFDADGAPLTGEFLVARAAPLALFTRIETAPLIGGGLLVSRVEPMPREGRSHRDWGTSSRALAVVASGADTASAPPPWIVSRPDTRLEIVRGGRGYAVLPLGSTSVPCTQRVEVLAPDGTVCGARDYRIAEGLCDTLDVTLGADGTVIQRLTVSMETHADTTGPHTCTWRWWPGALR